MEQIFRVGDTVYHWRHGKGEIISINTKEHYSVRVMFEEGFKRSFTLKGLEYLYEPPTLSHTPYNLINGGFSQRKPLPKIKKGTPVYIKMPTSKRWVVRIFSHFNSSGEICTFNDSYLEDDTTNWKEYSLENPIKYDEE